MSTERYEQRDELIRIIDDRWHGYGYSPSGAADAILAAGYRKPRMVSTAAELYALGFQTVVMSAGGEVWRLGLYSADNLDEDGTRVYENSDIALPATVLHEPEEGQ